MITALLIFFALALEYIYDPVSNMKDTKIIDSSFLKFKNFIKDYKLDKIYVYLSFPVIIFFIFSIVEYFLYNFLHPIFSFLLSLAVLLYCLKPNEFNQNLESLKFSVETNNELEKSKRFEHILYSEKESGIDSIIDNVFYNSIRNIFTILFTFLVLGTGGCLIYIVIDNYLYSDEIKIDQKSRKFLKIVISILEYLPIRITAFTFAVVANFELCMNKWRSLKNQKEIYNNNISLINNIGMASFKEDEGENEEKLLNKILYVQSMISRSLLAWLSIIGFLIIGGVFI